ncbi:LCP family protein [Humidisolicoccus flavus]|uniref:LCP family protein n=1 Tax=Humidisolicoccus flavus TaxID=3111414 RepID=UPI00324B27EA
MTETTEPTTPAKKRNPRKRQAIAWVTMGIVAALILTVGFVVVRMLNASDDIETVEDAFPEESLRPEKYEGPGNGPLNYLLLGSDTRGSGDELLTGLGDRADTILVVHIPSDRQSVQVMSIMRDSWVDIPGHGEAKINAALSYGAVPLMVQVVEGLIGQRIDDVAVIDFEGFNELTDVLGGVTVFNEVPFSATGIQGHYTYDQGEITIRGDEALAFVRERYAFSDGDYQRVRNQQAFMRGLLDSMLEPSVLLNPLKMTDIIEEMAPYLAATDGISTGNLIGLAGQFAGSGMPNVQTFTLPTTGTGRMGSQSVVLVDWDQLALVQEAFQQESMNDFTPPEPR